MTFRSRSFALALTLGVLSACSGGGGGSHGVGFGMPPMRESADATPTIAVTFSFKIPKPQGPLHPHYMSPSTKSIKIDVFGAQHAKVTTKISNVSPSAAGCSSLDASFYKCLLVVKVPSGSYTADVEAFSKASANGNGLSAVAGFKFAATKAKTIAMAMGGIPAYVLLSLPNPNPLATIAPGGFRFGGIGTGAAQNVEVDALDAENNLIVNPGAPKITLTSNAPARLSVKAGAGLGMFVVTPLAQTNALASPNPSTAITLTAKAVPAGTGTGPVSGSIKVQNDPVVFEGGYGFGPQVQVFAPWSAAPILILPSAPATDYFGIEHDAAGNVYVCNYDGGTVSVFAPGKDVPKRTITGIDNPCYPNSMAVDSDGNIFVGEYDGAVKEFTPGGGNSPSRTLPNGYPVPVVDKNGVLYVANYSTTGISVFDKSTTNNPTFQFNSGMSGPFIPAFDSQGNLYVANYDGTNVTEYSPPFSSGSMPVNTFGDKTSISDPYGMGVDGLGNVYVANDGAGVTEYNATSKTTPVRTLAKNEELGDVAFDQFNNVYVASYSTGTVKIFPKGTSVQPIMTWSDPTAADGWSIDVWP